jgi:uncharacterized membrane protein
LKVSTQTALTLLKIQRIVTFVTLILEIGFSIGEYFLLKQFNMSLFVIMMILIAKSLLIMLVVVSFVDKVLISIYNKQLSTQASNLSDLLFNEGLVNDDRVDQIRDILKI